MLNVLLVTSCSVIFGVDIGDQHTKIAMALMGKGVHIALNAQSKRLSDSIFSIWNTSNPTYSIPEEQWTLDTIKQISWEFSYMALSHFKKYPNSTIKGMNDLLGNYHCFSKRETLGMMIKHFITNVDESRWKLMDSHLVITVKPWMSHRERYAINEAGLIANTTVTCIVDEPYAAATLYALEKQSKYSSKQKIVVFYDIGASHSWVSIFKFAKRASKFHADQLSLTTNKELGGDVVDRKISERIKSLFKEKNNLDTIEFSDRVELRFLNEARRVKEALTVNDNANISMEDIIGDMGIAATISRSEVEEMVSEESMQVRALLEEAVEAANIDRDDIDSIELIGGATRIPAFQDAIADYVGQDKLNRTLNSNEAVALGAGYVGASKSSSFVIKPAVVSTFCGVNVSLLSNGTTTPIFGERSRTDQRVTLNYTWSKAPKEFTVCVDGDGEFFSYKIVCERAETSDILRLTFGFDQFMAPTLVSARIAGKHVKIVRSKAPWMLSPEERRHSKSLLETMDTVLRKRKERALLNNDYESLIIEAERRLEGDLDFKHALSEDEWVLFRRGLQKYSVRGHEKRVTNNFLREKIKILNQTIRNVESRIYEREHREDNFAKLRESIETAKELLPLKDKKGLEEQGEKFEELEKKLRKAEEWLAKAEEKLLQETEFCDPLVTSREILKANKELARENDKLSEFMEEKDKDVLYEL